MSKKIGFTCSAFDLFHAGHVAMLEETKKHCDWLIVGLQSDPSIDRVFKNKPVQSLLERQLQVRACKYVDEIIVYDTEKDLELLLDILPINVRFVGEEYKGMGFTGGPGTNIGSYYIHYNRRSHKFSSTQLKERIKNDYQTDGYGISKGPDIKSS
jgi:glycerol-3-phosphate cytidylyltransferase